MKVGTEVRDATDPHAARQGVVVGPKMNPAYVRVRWNDGEERVEHVTTLRRVVKIL